MRKAFLCAAMVALSCGFALGQAQYKVLYNFGSNPNDGVFGGYTLVSDLAGKLYGVTSEGGTMDGGIVFELSPNSDGSWSETTLYSFCSSYSSCPSGGSPTGALVLDQAGNLYGMTSYGGQYCPYVVNVMGCGVVFELSPPSTGGGWTYSVLYSFCSVGEFCEDGGVPLDPLTLDESGNLYGTTELGGGNEAGTVFELSPTSGGWTETVLYSFCSLQQNGYCLDGAGPVWGVTFDKSGNLYGTTFGGGDTGSKAGGSLYKLTLGPGGWTESLLLTFKLPKGGYSADPGPVSIDPTGAVYTTLGQGGNYGKGAQHGYGAVGRLGTNGRTDAFLFDGTDGQGPFNGVVVDDRRHVLYGTTGGQYFVGNVFQIDSLGRETTLYTFCAQPGCTDGNNPGGLLEDKLGNLYGTTLYGGNQGGEGYGVVFELTP
jgi:uncharacterized repeat protein (TIGR03803 family)